MLRRLTALLSCMVLAFGATSCVRDDIAPDGNSGSESTVRFALSVPGAAQPGETRTMTEVSENKIINLRVLLFSPEDGKFNCIRTPQQVDAAGDLWEVELPKGTFDLMVLANAGHSEWLTGLAPFSITWNDFASKFTVNWTEKDWSTRIIAMFGYKKNVTIDGNTSFTGDNLVHLHRNIARIDLHLSALAASGTEDGTGNDNFALREVYFVNNNTRGRIVPSLDAAHWRETAPGRGVALKASLPDNPVPQLGVDNALRYDAGDGAGFTASSVVREIYAYEVAGGDATTRNTNPCLIFGGSYKGGATTYYRVDFISKQNGQDVYLDLLRNHLYEVTVNKVSGPGYGTPQQAFDAVASNAEVSILKWEETAIGDIVFDGTHYFGISSRRVVFAAEGGEKKELVIETDVPDFTLSLGGTERLRANGALECTEEEIEYKLAKAGDNRYALSINCKKANMSATPTPKKHDWTIRAGRMELALTVEQSGIVPDDVVHYILYWDGAKINVGQWGEGTVTQENIIFTKFGSTVGILGREAWSAANVVFNPVGGSTWEKYGNIPAMAAEVEDVNYVGSRHDDRNLEQGLGDICRLVGLTPDQARALVAAGTLDDYDSGFRLPQTAESEGLYTPYNFTNTSVAGTPGRWLSGTKNFLPYAGGLKHSDGTILLIGQAGRWHHGSSSDKQGSGVFFRILNPRYYPNTNTDVAVQPYTPSTTHAGSNVRCIPTRRPSVVPAYGVTVTTNGGGTASADRPAAVPGEQVRVLANPAPDKAFRRWVVVGGSPQNFNADANPATFVMPAGNVALRAEFAQPMHSGNGRITFSPDGRYVLTTEPRDAGLYFRFGSVAGIYSAHGKNLRLPGIASDEFHPEDVAWSPVSINTWGDVPLFTQADWDAGIRHVTPYDNYHTVANVKAGKGDPCRLVGLDLDKIKNTPADQLEYADIDNGLWRLPTVDENKTFMQIYTNDNNYTAHYTAIGGVPGAMFPDASSGRTETFLPANGFRNTDNGATNQAVHQVHGEYLTTSGFEAGGSRIAGWTLYFSDTRLYCTGGNTMAFGARCQPVIAEHGQANVHGTIWAEHDVAPGGGAFAPGMGGANDFSWEQATTGGTGADGSVCPAGWRIPTAVELCRLINLDITPSTLPATYTRGTESGRYTSVAYNDDYSVTFTPKTGGSPITLYSFSPQQSQFWYWSSTLYDHTRAKFLYFDKDERNGALSNHNLDSAWFRVRCVKA